MKWEIFISSIALSLIIHLPLGMKWEIPKRVAVPASFLIGIFTGLVVSILSAIYGMKLYQIFILQFLLIIGISVALLLWRFFRDPERIPPEDQNAILSPADGKVTAITPIEYDEHFDGAALQIAIFLSMLNVHVQRVPADAQVNLTRYRPGRFLAAFKPEASEENEQAITCFTGNGGKFTVKQIAGSLARRVCCYMQPDSSVKRGDRLGFIRFGSRVEIIVPSTFRLEVKMGERVKGAVSIIGYFS